MILSDQLQKERKKKNLTLENLSGLISEELNLVFHVNTLKSWESGDTSIDVRVLPFLSTLYGVSIEDLVDEQIEPEEDRVERFFLFGKEISEYCQVSNLQDFLRGFQIVNKEDWIIAPKYDLIMRIYRDYLKREELFSSVFDSLRENLQYWLGEDERWKSGELYMNIYDDSAGYTSIEDERDPISPISHGELLIEIEALMKDLNAYLEIYERAGFKRWEYL
ncbi:helix-turn-helix domain-containing protein [Oceanobacillus neutriphilus]|uniref:HTH cro/C1-type domain-containing protein n=1 Tax=Oceanobacillus neutriphilus TaxID=531815 RepID=A0ABQ2NV02_9BACI|nr:helix-turn-helix transcriptional regulator [Oceanobacillus neutriphilus]GGP11168.1 hypothetical protein GCM10011346_22260 [Oceanobacillus neutriphilus]